MLTYHFGLLSNPVWPKIGRGGSGKVDNGVLAIIHIYHPFGCKNSVYFALRQKKAAQKCCLLGYIGIFLCIFYAQMVHYEADFAIAKVIAYGGSGF